MEKLFVSYSIAEKALEHGFNEPCFAVWRRKDNIDYVKTSEIWSIIDSKMNSGEIKNFIERVDLFDSLTNEFKNSPLYKFKDELSYFANGTWSDGRRVINSDRPLSLCTAPLYQQIIDWLSEKHKITIIYFYWTSRAVKKTPELVPTQHQYTIIDERGKEPEFKDGWLTSKELAVNESIEEALKLITN